MSLDCLDRCTLPLLRTGVWYNDRHLDLEMPAHWDVTVYNPAPSPALTSAQIASALDSPKNAAPLKEMCRGVRQPLVVIDDVNRPTATAEVLPFVLRHFQEAGISANEVTILLATGTHAQPRWDSVLKKVGPEAASACKLLVHDCRQPMAYLGKTSFKTPLFVNKAVVESDFVIGIGGIYPNHSAGYGGGSKLALGVLGLRSILSLHYMHRNIGWGLRPARNTFRDDLDEIARRLGIRSMISVQVDADRKPIRIRCGDYISYYEEEVEFAKQIFSVPLPGDADVVISNAYPNDLTLTFAVMKGSAPLYRCASGSSRILLASCPEGLGGHGLFPVVNVPRFHKAKSYLQLARTMGPLATVGRLSGALAKRLNGRRKEQRSLTPSAQNPVWLYRPRESGDPIPCSVPRVNVVNSWKEILRVIEQEQGDKRRLKVAVYPCTPLLSLPGSAQNAAPFAS